MTANTQAPAAPLRAALSWRLLLASTLAALVPTLIVTTPLALSLGELFDYSARGDMPHALQSTLLLDSIIQLGHSAEALQGALAISLLVTLLVAPFCAGLAVAMYEEPGASFMGLTTRAVGNYARLFRLMLVSIIPFGIAGGIAAGVMAWAREHGEKATLESAAKMGSHAAWIVTIVLVLVAQLSVEAARAEFAANGELRSALRAWGRGLKLIVARPGAALMRYLTPTAIAFVVALVLVVLRVRAGSAAAAFVLTQLAVAAIAWGRAGRILALAELARAQKR